MIQKRRNVAGPVSPPDLLKLFDDIQLDDKWEQLVPSTTLLQLGISAAPIRGADPVRALLPLPEPLPHPHPQPEPPPRGGGGTRLNNTAFIAKSFSRFKEMATVSCRTLREKIRRGDLPPLPMSKVETSKPMCLAWHTCSECNSNCSCKYDHVVTYTDGECQELVAWCNANFHE